MPFALPAPDEKPRYVRALFDGIARRYDLLNDVMTAGMHRRWKDVVVAQAAVQPGQRVLDACTGTGDIALRLALAVEPGGSVVGLDFSPEMLAVARKRLATGLPITWVEGDLMALPFDDDSFDAVTVGYGLRNVRDIPGALAEILRVLKPGGRVVSLDLGKPTMPVWRELYRAVFRLVIPLLGKVLAGSGEAYTYLPESCHDFPAQEGLLRLLAEAGFHGVAVTSLAGGAAAVHLGVKP